MLFDDTYLSIKIPSEGQFKDRGSKFLAFAYPVKDEQQIKMILSDLKREYHDARHHCYAWRLGPGKQAFRTNDDGEPSNTAGKPIFGQIQSNDLTDILIVVVRYFGGTLLGVGGLINAYRSATAEALKHAHIIEKYIYLEYMITFPFENMNEVMKCIKQFNGDILSQESDMNCSIKFSIKKSLSEQCETKLKTIPSIKLDYL